MRSTMMQVPLSVNHLLERGRQFFGKHEIISRLPDKSIARTNYSALYDRARRLAAALVDAGVRPGEPVGTLMWNSSWHLEAYFGIPAAGGFCLHPISGYRRMTSPTSSEMRVPASFSSMTFCCHCSNKYYRRCGRDSNTPA
jgi:acyl-CoA synthetase (AMP-forming)/AMP-acid ligase II